MSTETAELLEVRPSKVHGLGVYATRLIAKETCLIEYTGKRVLWKDVPEVFDGQHTFLFGLDDGIHVIDPEVRGKRSTLDQSFLRAELRSDRR